MSVDVKEKPEATSSGWGETFKIIIHALILAMIVRVFFYQPFNIPSGSMKSNLLVGDYLFVSKYSYGYSKYTFPFGLDLFSGRVWADEPKRGDVVVFKLPSDNSSDYIKRVIGLPGDKVQMLDGILHINGKPVPKRKISNFKADDGYGNRISIPRYEETLPNGVTYTVLDSNPDGELDTTQLYEVPAGHYFMMGDNRDNSTDSRVLYHVGYVPFENLIGKAQILFLSLGPDEDESGSLLGIRWSRFFKSVD